MHSDGTSIPLQSPDAGAYLFEESTQHAVLEYTFPSTHGEPATFLRFEALQTICLHCMAAYQHLFAC